MTTLVPHFYLHIHMPLGEGELLTLPEHISSPWGSCYSVFSCLCITFLWKLKKENALLWR